MNIDSVLESAKPSDSLTMRERAELERLIEAVHSSTRRRPRRRLIAGIVAATVLVIAGGATATAAAGVWHPSWYDPASNWTTDVKTVHLAFAVDDKRYKCTVDLSLSSTYNGKGTPEFQKTLAYLQSLDLAAIKPDPAMIDDFMNATWVGYGDPPAPPSKPWAYEQVWIMAVNGNVGAHLSSIGLDPQKISLAMDPKCDFSR